jgi:two-component system chemotaxis sensor kinase CheA
MKTNVPWLSSVGAKIFAIIFAITATLVTSLAVYFPARQMASARAALEGKAETYGRLCAHELEPAVAFGDRETARELFEALALDPDVRAAALFDARGRLLHARGELPGAPPAAPPAAVVVADRGDAIRATARVASREGPTGTLVIELSTARLDAQNASVRIAAALIGALALAAGAALALLAGRALARRLGAVASAASAVAAGDLSRPMLDARSGDEIGQLGRAFDGMVANIKALMDQIAATAAAERTRLDALVAERTAALDRRNDDMRRLLDHVDQGFFTLDRAGVMSPERSRIVDAWLGAPRPGGGFAAAAGALDPHFAACFAVAWEMLVDGEMPAELALDQLPTALRRGEIHYRLAYTPLGEPEAPSGVLVVMTDVTHELERERADEEQREILAAFSRLLRDRRDFMAFLEEASALAGAIARREHTSLADEKRAIHTLKGATAMFGLARVARVCDAVEQGMAERRGHPTADDRAQIMDVWTAASTPLRELLRGSGGTALDVERRELERLLAAIREGEPRGDLARRVGALFLEPVSARLHRIADEAHTLAERLGKPDLTVTISADQLRLDPTRWAPFWASFTHAVRNAIDHGIESPDEREVSGKPRAGELTLRAYAEAGAFMLEIADDGRGVAWDAVRERARTYGLPSVTRAELEEALFADGLSTREEASDISGRGVGLGALRAACRALRGRVTVHSVAGRGTTFQLCFPLSVVGDNAAVEARINSVAPPALA